MWATAQEEKEREMEKYKNEMKETEEEQRVTGIALY